MKAVRAFLIGAVLAGSFVGIRLLSLHPTNPAGAVTAVLEKGAFASTTEADSPTVRRGVRPDDARIASTLSRTTGIERGDQGRESRAGDVERIGMSGSPGSKTRYGIGEDPASSLSLENGVALRRSDAPKSEQAERAEALDRTMATGPADPKLEGYARQLFDSVLGAKVPGFESLTPQDLECGAGACRLALNTDAAQALGSVIGSSVASKHIFQYDPQDGTPLRYLYVLGETAPYPAPIQIQAKQ